MAFRILENREIYDVDVTGGHTGAVKIRRKSGGEQKQQTNFFVFRCIRIGARTHVFGMDLETTIHIDSNRLITLHGATAQWHDFPFNRVLCDFP